MRYYDVQKFACWDCGHVWILASEKLITNEQHHQWIRETLEQHKEIHRENKKDE